MRVALLLILSIRLVGAIPESQDARDRQDMADLSRHIARLREAAEKKPQDAASQYQLALAHSYLSEVALELKDKNAARQSAEEGIEAAKRAVALSPTAAEHHRILGTLCGQVIPANVLAGLKHGRCAMDSIGKAVELDPRSAEVWISRGVGNYYLPSSFGGGVQLAIADFEKAIKLSPKSADAHLWLGIALRKAGRNADAHKALARAVELNPKRIWARQQLEKTPAK
jgi:tetratricopeptide (TPR) repeat protein